MIARVLAFALVLVPQAAWASSMPRVDFGDRPALGIGLGVLISRRPREEGEPALSAEEEARLKSLVDQPEP